MTRSDPDQDLLRLLWLVRGGRLCVNRNGVEAFHITHNGVDPELDIRDLDALKSLLTPISPSFMERMRKLSKKMAESNKNIVITFEGKQFLNFGSRGTLVKDVEGFAGMLLKRVKELSKRQKKLNF